MKRNELGLTEKEFLQAYNPSDYERPSVTVDMMVVGMNKRFDGLKLLLIQRKDHPFLDCWALAGGFIGIDESAYQAACRKLKAETGLTDVYLEQLYTMSAPKRDPRMRVIDIAYIALIPETPLSVGEDAKDAAWFDIDFSDDHLIISNDELGVAMKYKLERKVFQNGVVSVESPILHAVSKEQLAFDHAEIVLNGLLRLQNKVEYSDIAFNLMPENFTLPDLQKVYEILLGKELYKTNFRDKIKEKVEGLDQKGVSITGGKKSALYRYRSNQNGETSIS